MTNYLRIYGASDDLVEFQGAFVEEYNIYERTAFHIDVESPRGLRSFTLTAEFGDFGWELSFGFFSGEDPGDDFACDPSVCQFTNVTFRHRGKNNDPTIFIPLEDDETVSVQVGDGDEDGE